MKCIILAAGLLAFVACNNKTEKPAPLPAVPASIEKLRALIHQQKYATGKVATVSPFEMDKDHPYQWMSEAEDTTAFAKNYLAERLAFALDFVNDSSVVMNEDGKTIKGIYKIDKETAEDEKAGIKIRISYPDESMNLPGMTDSVMMTYSFFVAGADETSLLLETPRSYNNRKIAILMKKK